MKGFIFFFLLLFTCYGVYGDQKVAYTGMTREENEQFEDQIDQALIKEELKIRSLQEKIERQKKRLPPSVQLELTKAKLNLEVKTTLAKNYLRTSVLQSEKVRDELIRILNKNSINLDDLVALQKLVSSEKKRIME